MSPYRYLIPLAFSSLLTACEPPERRAESAPPSEASAAVVTPSETLESPAAAPTPVQAEPLPRWPVERPPYQVEKGQWPQIDVLEELASGDESSRMKVIATLKQSVSEVSDWQPDAYITAKGIPPGEAGEKVLRLRQDTFENALLWRLTGDAQYGDRARALLLRFAAVYRQWPFYFNDKSFPVTDRGYLRRWDARALWGRWYPLDLPACLPLLRAYDLAAARLTPEERERVVADIFVYQKELVDGFSGTGAYHNMIGYHLIALIRFGQLLERGDWVHEAVKEWREAIMRGYTSDGIYREVTVDYHSQLTHRLVNIIPALLKGYSDPPGYRHAGSGERFDQLDLNTEYDTELTRIRNAFPLLAKPDGRYLNTNDSWPNRIRLRADESLQGAGLLGAAGVAKLAIGEMAVFLKYHGIRGHDHRDALSLAWYANGREVFSETAYRPERGEFDRRWSAGTASHFTATIDGAGHFEELQAIPAKLTSFTAKPPTNPGPEPVRAAYAGASRYENQGRLLIWNAVSSDAQAMEVEQPGAYPSAAEVFRRTLVLVPYDAHSGYLVEFFRVRGGRQHDYFLRGSLDEPYQWQTDLPGMQPASGKEYDFIALKEKGAVTAPFSATARYGDGTQVRSLLAGLPSAQGAAAEYLIGTAPAIRRSDQSTFTLLRNRAQNTGAPLESAFVWVHEATPGASQIGRVELHREGHALIATIHRAGAVDTVISNFAESDVASRNGWTLKGRLAFGSEQGGQRKGVLLSGESLAGGDTPLTAAAPLRGVVRAATTGATPTATIALNPGQSRESIASIRLAHFDVTAKTRLSIPVKAAKAEGDEVVLTLAYPTGFEPKEWGSLFYAYPGWRIRGACHVVLE